MRRLCLISIYHYIFTFILVSYVSAQAWSVANIIPAGYDPKMTPNPLGQRLNVAPIIDAISLDKGCTFGLTNVNMSITVNDLTAVTETDSSFQLDMTLKLKWFDNRLNLSVPIKSLIQSTNNTIDTLLLDSTYVSKFWIPDIYFQNALSISIVNSGLPVQYLAFGLNNNITYTVRMSAKFICKMNLKDYPQDYQYCSLEAVSLTQTSTQLQITWDEFVSGFSQYPKFRIRKTFTGTCTRTSYVGDFSCKSATLKLVRRLSYYVIRVYAPTWLSVVVVFVGFWIPILGWPARVTIIVTPLLALITQDIGLNNDISVAYVVAIHWWMIWCQVFVYLALIEYAVAISWAHFTNDKKALRAAMTNNNNNNSNGFDGGKLRGHYFGNKNWFDRSGQVIDKILHFFFGSVDFTKDPLTRNKVDYCARIIFPSMWIFYTLIYIFTTVCPWAANYDI